MNRTTKLILLYWLPFFVYAVFVFYFSSLPDPYVKMPATFRPVFSFSSMIIHLVEYCIFYILLWRALNYSRFSNAFGKSFVFTLVYSVLDEVHQLFVYGRYFSVGDLFFDMVGAFLGWALIVICGRLLNKSVFCF
ncbi:MAG: VanZ family protein [Nanoarchaeota archaeon]|nr:VanZ family protein [Nanoarchaeota archaeon]